MSWEACRGSVDRVLSYWDDRGTAVVTSQPGEKSDSGERVACVTRQPSHKDAAGALGTASSTAADEEMCHACLTDEQKKGAKNVAKNVGVCCVCCLCVTGINAGLGSYYEGWVVGVAASAIAGGFFSCGMCICWYVLPPLFRERAIWDRVKDTSDRWSYHAHLDRSEGSFSGSSSAIELHSNGGLQSA